MNMNTHPTRLLSLLIPLLMASSCAQDGDVDLGASVTGASLADYVASWEGYTEASQLVFGSDRVRLRIDRDGQGTVIFGESQTYPVATDPNVGYPPNEDQMQAVIKLIEWRPGMQYPLHDAKVENKRIRFTLMQTDFYKTWCELQTPVETDQGGFYSCSTGGFSRDPSGVCSTSRGEVIDCSKAMLCIGVPRVCTCTETSCTSAQDSFTQWDAALRDNGKSMEGTFQGVTVRLERR